MRRRSYNLPRHAHFLTFSCHKRYPVFFDPDACRMLGHSLTVARAALRFELWAYVFMPDHVHLLLRPRMVPYSITAILRRIKSPFAKALAADWRAHHSDRLTRLCANVGSRTLVRIWQPGGGFDRNLYSERLIRRAVEYIEANPVRKGLLVDPRDWIWSSARARAGRHDVPIPIDEIRWEVEEHRGARSVEV